jgi:hypothetical protein
VQASYLAAQSELNDAQARRSQLAAHRNSGEAEAVIAVALARPVRSGDRIRGTVATISDGCTKVDGRTVEACAEIALLRQELAIAREAVVLDQLIAEHRLKVDRLRERGGTLDADPQAEFLSKLSRGWLSPSDIGLSLVLLLAAVIELVSAFGPVVLTAYAQTIGPFVRPENDVPTTRGSTLRSSKSASQTVDEDPVGQVVDYMAERIEPAETSAGLGAEDLIADHQAWCRSAGVAALGPEDFISDFDEVRHEQRLADHIGKFGRRYYGIRLVTKNIAKLASRKK